MKKYILEIILFIVLALVVNIVFQYFLLKDREPQFFSIKADLSEQNDYIMFGSSVNGYHKSWYTDRRNMSEMVDSLCPSIDIKSIWRPSASIENFYTYLHYSIKCNNIPKLVIVPINIRAFSYDWSRPEYTALIAKERIFLNYGIVPYIFRKIVPKFSREINQQTHEAFYEESIIVNGEILGKVKDYVVEDKNTISDTILHYQKSFTLNYMCDITNTNRKVVFLNKFDSLCKINNIEAIYYLTPIDYTSGNKYIPVQFSKKTLEHSSFFKEILDSKDKQLLDLTFELDSTYFTYELMPNEHLLQEGKHIVAGQISKEVLKRLNSEVPK